MLGSASVYSRAAELLLIAMAVVLVFSWLARRLGHAVLKNVSSSMPRTQSVLFVYRLRDLIFSDPFRFMSRLCAEDRQAFVQRLWVEGGWKVARARQVTEPADPAMDVQRFQFRDGRTIAVVCLPERQGLREALFVGVVLPMNESLMQDISRARQVVRFFVLHRFGGPDTSRVTDLRAWTAERRELTYNVGAPADPEGFARAVEAKLKELRR